MTRRRLAYRVFAVLSLLLPLIGVGVLYWMEPAHAQTLSLDLGDGPGASSTARIIQLVALLTVLSLAPGILIMVTSFVRIVVVLSLLRTALGTQQSPPNMVMVSLALFLTGFIMAPVLSEAYEMGIQPLIDQEIDETTAFENTIAPFRTFMLANVRPQDLDLFLEMAEAGPDEEGVNAPLRALVPAFMISELRRAFEIGFLIYIPFVIIDMVLASILMSMGMMMIPPIIISLPFKLIFFVLVDGWYKLAGALVRSFSVGP